MKQRTLIASLLMAGLLGTVPGMALADGHGNYKTRKEVQRDYRGGDRVRHGNQDYVYRGGRFYRPDRGGLVSVRAPIGGIIASLPFGFSAVVASGNTYFHAEGSYYRQVPRGYMVCDAPVVAPVPRHHGNQFSSTVVVQPAMLNVRSGPGRSFAVSSQVVRGERLNIRSNSDGWFYVQTPRGISGWVMMQFTSPYVAG
jgi:hypothetical protein